MSVLRWHPSGHGIALIAFLVWFCILISDVKYWAYRDPGSAFFDAERSLVRQYSLTREAEAVSYIENVNRGVQQVDIKATTDPSLCVGVTTTQREWTRDKHFRRLMGSLLDGLTVTERQDIYLMPFVANYDYNPQQSYGGEWLDRLSDRVLSYQEAPEDVRVNVLNFEMDGSTMEEKAVFDYIYLLQHAYELGTPYVVMLEDEAIAADGWFKQTKAAIDEIEGQLSRNYNRTLYLRLFYDEQLLGWNSEEWPSYIMRILMVEISVLAVLLLAIGFIPGAAPIIGVGTIFTIMLLVVPMLIALYFAAGRLTVAPLWPGVNRMDSSGCCTQAIVFPRQQIPGLVEYLQAEQSGPLNQLTERYANENGLWRYALTPSVFTYVGPRDTAETWGQNTPQDIWNFGFEAFDKDKLKDEHL